MISEKLSGVPSRQGQLGNYAGTAHARKPLQTRGQVEMVGACHCRALHGARRHLHAQGEHAARVEPRISSCKRAEALHNQGSANDQHQAERDLRDDDRVAERTRLARRAADGSRAEPITQVTQSLTVSTRQPQRRAH
jgi:hypothetical protein